MLFRPRVWSIDSAAPLDVVERAEREFRSRTFAGRHPILMFVVLPLLVLQLGYAASLFSVVGTGGLLKKLDPAFSSDLMSPGGTALVELLCGSLILASATATAGLFAWLAVRAEVHRRWPIITGAMMGLLAGLTQMSVYMCRTPAKAGCHWDWASAQAWLCFRSAFRRATRHRPVDFRTIHAAASGDAGILIVHVD